MSIVGLSDTTILAIYCDILLLTIVIPCLYITVIKNPFVMQYLAKNHCKMIKSTHLVSPAESCEHHNNFKACVTITVTVNKDDSG